VLHALQRPDHVPTDELAKIREHTAAPIHPADNPLDSDDAR